MASLTKMPARAKPARCADKPATLGAEKLTPAGQRRRFIEAAREAGVSEDETEFDRALGKLVRAKT